MFKLKNGLESNSYFPTPFEELLLLCWSEIPGLEYYWLVTITNPLYYDQY